MKRRRRTVLLLTVVPILLMAGAWWLGGLWLEGSGGRALLERELSRRVGLPVRLQGDFDLMVIPSVGVSGSKLAIGQTQAGSELFSSRAYEVSVALAPLLEGELLVEWVRVSDGILRLEDVAAPLYIESLTIQDFAADRPTPFELKVPLVGAAAGILLWESERRALHFSELDLATAGGAVQGWGCVLFEPSISLHLDLSSRNLDLDAVLAASPFSMPAGGDGIEGRPDLHLRLTAAELHAAGAIAREAEFSLGSAPDCNR